MRMINVRSAMIGAGLASVVFGLLGMTAPSHPRPFQIDGIPTPEQMMRVVEGLPFTVPDGKVFVCTGVAATTAQYGSSGGLVSTVEIHFDGMPVLAANIHTKNDPGTLHAGPTTLPAIPPGLVAQAGTVISADLDSDGPLGIVLGYLADA